jgi:hypothetical protein
MSTGSRYATTSTASRPMHRERGRAHNYETYSSAAAPIEAPDTEITAFDVACAVAAFLIATATGVSFAVSIFYFLFV